MRTVTRVDALVAGAFVAAALVEAPLRHGQGPGPLALACAGAPVLAVLAVRRLHPTATICAIAGFAVLGTLVQQLVWPDVSDDAGVWIFGLMLACYSLGAHAAGRVLALGGLAPLAVVVTADFHRVTGWQMLSGIAFVTLFIGVVPTAVGALVRRRRSVLRVLADQRAQILAGRRAESWTAVVAERVRADERLRPVLLDGLRDLARLAEDRSAAETIEERARELLGRARREVLALTAPVDETVEPEHLWSASGHLAVLRAAAQPWVVVLAGALAVGLALESTQVMTLDAPGWVATGASFLVAAPVALICWRPLWSLVLGWGAAGAFSHAVAPLDGTLSGSALALALAFLVAVVSDRRSAVVGLLLCWLGAALGLSTQDPLGVGAVILAAWLGGLVVNEVTGLVEQSRANNRRLLEQAGADARRAVVEERLRLARELHDVLGHSLTIVALQAGAARRLAPTDPTRAGESLRAIAEAAREGITAFDRERPGDAAYGAGGLFELLDRTRGAGLTLDVEVDDLAGVHPATRHAVERVVQESLTNVLRHAPGARALVRVTATSDGVGVLVRNSRPTDPGTGPGSSRGLAGVRERVTGLAGDVSWGPRADGGFEVRAHLPAEARTVVG